MRQLVELASYRGRRRAPYLHRGHAPFDTHPPKRPQGHSGMCSFQELSLRNHTRVTASEKKSGSRHRPAMLLGTAVAAELRAEPWQTPI